tara:strand:- start:532 stop:945 length:414 start_codon:yes stop_codon:yes gene_type:complete
MRDILELYRKFDMYKELNDADLRLHLFPCLNLDQNRKHYINDKLVGFTNWAFLSDKAQVKFKKTGLIDREDWRSGNHLWHIDTVATSHLQDVISWTKNHFTQKFGTDKEINWLRIKDDTIIRQSTRTTKDNWLWAVS